jgi:hypothetical protein
MMPSRSTYLALVIATMVAGLILRFGVQGWPFWITKWGGSFLWAMMIYWIAALLFPTWKVTSLIPATGAIATVVELIRLYDSPGLDAFRVTLPGVLLLGRVFSWWDILTYWVAILIAAGIDSLALRSKQM